MVLMREMPKVTREAFEELEMPSLPDKPWTAPAAAAERRVAVVSSAGLSRRGDKPFFWSARDYRAFSAGDKNLVMTHIAVDYDRTAWQQDLNAILPVDRLREMAADGEIGGVAETHYSFMGATDPLEYEAAVREVAARMKGEGVNTVLLAPV